MLSVRASTNQRAMQAGAENTRGAVNTAHLEAEAEALNGTGKAIGALGEAYVKEMKERENRKLLAAINEFNKGMNEIKDPPPDGGGKEPVPEMPPSFAEQAKRVQDDVLARSGIRDISVKERFYLQSERNVIAREELLQNRRKEKLQLERDERVRSAGATAVELAVASGHDGDIDNAIASQLELLDSTYADEGSEALMTKRAAAVRDTVQAAAGARIERGDYTGAKDIVSRYKDELDAADYSRLQKVVGGYEEAGKRDAANRARYERFGDDTAAAHAEIDAENGKDPLRSKREIRSYDAYARMEKRRRENAVTMAQKGCVDEISAMVKEGTVSETALEGMRNRLLDESGLTGSERERLESSLGDMYGRMVNAPRNSDPLLNAEMIRSAINGLLTLEEVEAAWESGELSIRDYGHFLDKAYALGNDDNDKSKDALDREWLKYIDGSSFDDDMKATMILLTEAVLDSEGAKGMGRIETAKKLTDMMLDMVAKTEQRDDKKALGISTGTDGKANWASKWEKDNPGTVEIVGEDNIQADPDKDKYAKGGHYEVNMQFVNSAGLGEDKAVWMNKGSDQYDAYYNQASPGHAMENNDYNTVKKSFIKEYGQAWKCFDEATKETDAKKTAMYEKQAYLALGRANHIIGDYRSHNMRGKGNADWKMHGYGLLIDSTNHPDNPNNQPWLFENAKQASARFASLFKSGKRELTDEDILSLFPTDWEGKQ